MKYTTSGSVRGSCGHNHKTLGAAYDCLLRDRSGCRSQGGYSDRRIFRVVNGELESITLSEDETVCVWDWE